MGTVNKLSTIFSFSTFFLTFNLGLLPNKLIKTGWPGQTSQVVTRIPLLIRTIQPDQFISKHYVPAVTGFSKRFYQRLTFPFQNAGCGQPVLTFAKHPYLLINLLILSFEKFYTGEIIKTLSWTSEPTIPGKIDSCSIGRENAISLPWWRITSAPCTLLWTRSVRRSVSQSSASAMLEIYNMQIFPWLLSNHAS